MARLFGTDGVRGIANKDLNCELVYKIGQCGAKVLTNEIHKPRIVVGMDTRISGDMLFCALASGICSVGAEVVNLGIIPTPGVAYLTKQYGADAGVVISASHNSFEYNGIKWFNGDGFKLPDALENQIESLIKSNNVTSLPLGENVGRIVPAPRAKEEYIDYLVSCSDVNLNGCKVALDCANGASSEFAPEVFRRLGAQVYSFFNNPDGTNINASCGSTHPKRLQQLVVGTGADIGILFDGDADRMLAVDSNGLLIDGDIILAILALALKKAGRLLNNTLVLTVMSNSGMLNTLKEAGIDVETTAVGDRYVLECMREKGYNLGGEQSGHMIFLDKNTTGDGILSAVELLNVLNKSRLPFSLLSKRINLYPQVLVNVEVDNLKKYAYKDDMRIIDRIFQAEKVLNGKGRVLVRTSGTEPLIRVMVEGADDELISNEAIEISKLIAETFGGKIK